MKSFVSLALPVLLAVCFAPGVLAEPQWGDWGDWGQWSPPHGTKSTSSRTRSKPPAPTSTHSTTSPTPPSTPTPAASPTVDQKQLQNFNVYAQYAAAAYCQPNLFPTEKFYQITCTEYGGRCPVVEMRDPQTVGGFIENGTYQAGGFVAYDHSDKRSVVAFRGIAPTDKLRNMSDTLVACPEICARCRCREPVYNAWVALRPRVLEVIAMARRNWNYPIIVTGHGFGGAVATLAAAEIRNAVEQQQQQQPQNSTVTTNTTLYVYGSPRVGDRATAAWITGQGNNYRLTHTDDPIPKSSGSGDSSSLAHIAPEYWNHNDNTDFSVGTYQFQVFTGIEDQRGNLGKQGPDKYDPAAHIEYFMCNIGNCHEAYNKTRCDSFLCLENGTLTYVTG